MHHLEIIQCVLQFHGYQINYKRCNELVPRLMQHNMTSYFCAICNRNT